MDPQELDRQLRTITEHEALYRRGMQRSLARPFPTCRINGREVMQFSYAAISEEMSGVPFLVKKHSRYRTYPLHVHDWVELVYMYSGSSVQIVNDTRYTMHQGQVMLMAPGIVHTIEKLGTDDILIQIALGQDNLTHGFFNRISSTGIVSHFLLNAFTSQNRLEDFFLFPSEKSRRLHLFVTEFLCEWYDPSPVSYDMQNSLFSLIISELINTLNETSNHPAVRSKGLYVMPVLRYIENNYKNCSLQTAAQEFNLHPNYLSATLKKYTGFTFNALVQQERLTAAEKLLLNSDMSITDIANFVGYQNVSYFYKIFQRKNHCMPNAYRHRNR